MSLRRLILWQARRAMDETASVMEEKLGIWPMEHPEVVIGLSEWQQEELKLNKRRVLPKDLGVAVFDPEVGSNGTMYLNPEKIIPGTLGPIDRHYATREDNRLYTPRLVAPHEKGHQYCFQVIGGYDVGNPYGLPVDQSKRDMFAARALHEGICEYIQSLVDDSAVQRGKMWPEIHTRMDLDIEMYSLGYTLVCEIVERLEKDGPIKIGKLFEQLLVNPPSFDDLKNPEVYITRMTQFD